MITYKSKTEYVNSLNNDFDSVIHNIITEYKATNKVEVLFEDTNLVFIVSEKEDTKNTLMNTLIQMEKYELANELK